MFEAVEEAVPTTVFYWLAAKLFEFWGLAEVLRHLEQFLDDLPIFQISFDENLQNCRKKTITMILGNLFWDY